MRLPSVIRTHRKCSSSRIVPYFISLHYPAQTKIYNWFHTASLLQTLPPTHGLSRAPTPAQHRQKQKAELRILIKGSSAPIIARRIPRKIIIERTSSEEKKIKSKKGPPASILKGKPRVPALGLEKNRKTAILLRARFVCACVVGRSGII